jgi:hypothetical protein
VRNLIRLAIGHPHGEWTVAIYCRFDLASCHERPSTATLDIASENISAFLERQGEQAARERVVGEAGAGEG